jgi:hypothetical protein
VPADVGDQRARPRHEPTTYETGERVFGPPLGTFDVEWVAREVQRLTGADVTQAHRAVESAWSAARQSGSAEAASLTDALAAQGTVPLISQVTGALVAGYCAAYDVDPAAR